MNPTLFRVGVAHVAFVISASTFGCSSSEPAAEDMQSLTVDECEAAGGKPHADPGDGSSFRNGCPGSQEMIGTLKLGIEGGICCK